MLRRTPALMSLVATVLTLAGCSADEESTQTMPSQSPASSAATDATTDDVAEDVAEPAPSDEALATELTAYSADESGLRSFYADRADDLSTGDFESYCGYLDPTLVEQAAAIAGTSNCPETIDAMLAQDAIDSEFAQATLDSDNGTAEATMTGGQVDQLERRDGSWVIVG